MINKSRLKGVAAIELAVLLPFIIIILLLGVDLAKTMFQYNELVKNVRDATKYLASYTRPMNCGVATDPEVINYKAAITEAKNLAVCGNTTACGSKYSVKGLSISNIQVRYPADTNATMVEISINNMSLSYITNLFSGTLSLGNISSTFYQPQLDITATGGCDKLI